MNIETIGRELARHVKTQKDLSDVTSQLMKSVLKYIMTTLTVIMIAIEVSANPTDKNPQSLSCQEAVMAKESRLMSLRLEERILEVVEHRYNDLDKRSRDEIKKRVTTYKGNMEHIRNVYIRRELKIPYDEPRYARSSSIRYALTAHPLLQRVTGQIPYLIPLNEHSGLPLVDQLLVQDIFMYMITKALIHLYTVIPVFSSHQNTISVYREVLPSIADQYLQRIGFLLRQGANPNLYMEGLTYLMWASAYGLDHLVELLIRQNAEPLLRSRISDDFTFFTNATALEIVRGTLDYLNISSMGIYAHNVYRYSHLRSLSLSPTDLETHRTRMISSYSQIIDILQFGPRIQSD